MWYATIIPRLKRLFRNKEHARLLQGYVVHYNKKTGGALN
jgi:mannose/fructose/N-acetylgalactosamine-specific phosphotransferase system component IID